MTPKTPTEASVNATPPKMPSSHSISLVVLIDSRAMCASVDDFGQEDARLDRLEARA